MSFYISSPRVWVCAATLSVVFGLAPIKAVAQALPKLVAIVPSFFVGHKPKKQSTGSWKKNRETHQNLNKQKKEKKWHKKAETPGQGSFSPKKYRK